MQAGGRSDRQFLPVFVETVKLLLLDERIFRHHGEGVRRVAGLDLAAAQVERLLVTAIEACERYFQAFQFVVWAGKDAAEALEGVLFETVGEA